LCDFLLNYLHLKTFLDQFSPSIYTEESQKKCGMPLGHLKRVAHVLIPAIWEAEIGRITVQGKHGQKVVRLTPLLQSQPTSQTKVHSCGPSYVENLHRGTEVQSQPQAKNTRTYPKKITKAQKCWRHCSVGRHKVLSSDYQKKI
jgi:hypothetical protein